MLTLPGTSDELGLARFLRAVAHASQTVPPPISAAPLAA
jgi:hypothetical protein